MSVTESGTVESSRATEIKCEIRGGYGGRGGRSTVTWVIPSGSVVEEGDELVRLDTKVIEETISLGKTDTNIAQAALVRTETEVSKAKVAIDAYLNGTYRSQMSELEKQRTVAERNLSASKTLLSKTESLFHKGYATTLEVEAHRYTVMQAELELEVKRTEIDVLQRLTRAMQLETLNGQFIATQARLEGRKAGLILEQSRLELALEEFEKSVIRAPRAGLVIYPSTALWKDVPDVSEGASVHNNQVLLIMPDLSRMQVAIEIHESLVDRVSAGLRARVTLPDRTLETVVSSVASVSRPGGWWNGNVVRYETVVELPGELGLRPGMSADVEIILAHHRDVLSVPVVAVVQAGGQSYCWVEASGGPERRTLVSRDENEEFLVVESGLREGDSLILDPVASVDEARQLIDAGRVHAVERGALVVTLTEQGSLESSENTQIKCRVRGKSTINWVIENGTEVESGDVLVRLENKQIEEYLHERTKYAHLSRDAAIGHRAHATRAGLAISEYLEGRYRTELMALEKDLAIAQSKLRTGNSLLDHNRGMAEKGYVSDLDVERATLVVKEATLDVEIKTAEIDVLERFTKNEELVTLKGNWEAAKAAANAHEEVLAMDGTRMELAKKEIERCVIRADRSGLVIYPPTEAWKRTPDVAEGATAHQDQVLLLMPNLSKMQVKFGVHESMIDRVRPGMVARVQLPGRTLEGELVSVASTARPAGWWTGDVVKYDAIVRLPGAEGLKPGMSAEVEVTVSQRDDVLLLPLAALETTDEGTFCWTGDPEDPERRPVTIGDSNDQFAEVTSGLEEGETVLLEPGRFLE